MKGFFGAFKAFFLALGGTELTMKTDMQIPAPTEVKKEEPKVIIDEEAQRKAFEEGAVYTLMLLQREGRLIDFLQEDISAFQDAQIGAAVRQIHEQSGKVLAENFAVEPVIKAAEGEKVNVPDNFDASVFRMTGAVPAEAPYNGTLQHKGWKARNVNLPTRTGKVDTSVVCPAEVSF